MKGRVRSCILALCLLFLTGCGENYDTDQNTIFVGRDGKITETSVEEMNQSYYSDAELESFIADEIAAFEGADGTVEETGFEIADGIATLTLTYTDWKTYADFNRRQFYVGTVVKAQAEGYDFQEPFTKVENGEAVTRDQVLEVPDLKVVILETSSNVQLKVPGKIIYVSEKAVAEEKSIAAVEKSQNESITELAYIIYK